MKCNYCGAEFEGNFCPECGAKTENETITPPHVQEQKSEINYQQSMQGALIKPAKKKKPFYLRWWFIAIVVLVIGSVAMSIGKGGKNGGANKGKYEIPNVFGVNYEEATEILEADGFEVKAVETNPKDILNRLSYKVDTFEKGAVFKIDDYIQNGIGRIQDNDNYSDYKQMYSNDKSLVIYYAKEAYSKDEETSTSETENGSVEDAEKSDNPENDTSATSQQSNKSAGVRSDFKTAMDSYEKFFDEYVAIMKKYANNPGDTSILADYSKYMGKYAQMMSDFEKWESEDMNDAELAYYLEVQGRITKKLLEVSR